MSSRCSTWTALAAALIVVAGIAAWSNSFQGSFVFDDIPAIQDNATIRHFPALANLIPPASNPISRRPVVNFTFALNDAIGGLDAGGFHAGNLLIHLLAALTLFGIARHTLLLLGRQSVDTVPFAVALIWAVHPLQTESVTYLTQRTESLMGLLYLLTLYCAIRSAASPRPWRWYAAGIAACALGMGAKEVMATAPIVVLLYDRCFLSGSFHEALRRRLPFYLGLAATWAILGALLMAYPMGGTTGAGFGLPEASPWEYARSQPGVILNYLRLSFWPRPLCVDYGWPIATSAAQIIPQAAAIAAMLAATLWALRRAPALGFLGAWFFLILAPTSSFMPIKDLAFEHRMYLPLAAVVTACVIAACWLGGKLVRRMTASPETQKLFGRAAATAAVLCVAGAFGGLTFDRNADYRDPVALWTDTAHKRPRNLRAQHSLGTAYLQAGRADEAIESFTKAIELKADYFDAWNNRGAAYTQAGRLDEAVRDFNEVIARRPNSAAAYSGRAAAWLRRGRYDLAFADYQKAISLQPNDASGYNNLGVAYADLSRPAEAIPEYTTAIALKPDYAEAFNNRGVAYAATNHPAEALQDYDRAIALDPHYAEAFCNRAGARFRAAQYDPALQDYDRAIALRPDYAEAYSNRAAARANVGMFGPAISDCDKALALKPDYREAYINRAAAYSQIGRYEDALADVHTFQKLGGQPPSEFVKALLQAAGRPQ